MAKRKIKKTIIKTKKIPGVITAVSIIDYIYGALSIILAALLLLGGTLLSALGPLRNMFPDELLGGLVGGVIVLVSLIVLAFGILYVILGKAIKEFKMWAKIVQIILAIFSLFNFPIGTIIGVFILWVLLLNKETRDLYS